MINMIVKMLLITIMYIVISMSIWLVIDGKKMTNSIRIFVGIIFGICSILSTHFGINYGHMMLNVRDLGPLIAGLYFDPISGLISGIIGGAERYIAGTYFGVGYFTRIACSISTFIAGAFAYILSKKVYKGKRPAPTSAFFIGAVMEVFHMYVILITHRDDMTMAFYVVDECSMPMITFSAIGLAGTAIGILSLTEDWEYFLKKKTDEEISISTKIQKRLFIVTCVLMLSNVAGTFFIQNQSANQSVEYEMDQMVDELRDRFEKRERLRTSNYIGNNGLFAIYDNAGRIIYGVNKNSVISRDDLFFFKTQIDGKTFEYNVFDVDSVCRVISLGSEYTGIISIYASDVFWYRNAQTYESIFYAILMITVVYFVISVIVNKTVIVNLEKINNSLEKITNGDLNAVVNVRNSKEFAILSDDINRTVNSLKAYIEKEKQRIEEEMELANSIQMSSLTKNFVFPNHDEFEAFAIMDAAKGVGGDFYDFFFAGRNKLVLVIADVSGKGIPGAMFMMRAKTDIRNLAEKGMSPSDIMFKANNSLCEGNDNEMFVTAWLGIIDLTTNIMKCVNYGHEFPIIMKNGGQYRIFKDEHSLPLAALAGTKGKEYELKFEKGDTIFVYTDGVPEATNMNNIQYGMDRLVKVLNANKNENMESLLSKVRSDVEEFVGSAEQFDDITLLGFRMLK